MDIEEEPLPSVLTWMETCESMYMYINEKIIQRYKCMDTQKMVHWDVETNECIDGDVIRSQLLQRMEFNESHEKSLIMKIMNNHPSIIKLHNNEKTKIQKKTVELKSWNEIIDQTFDSNTEVIDVILLEQIKDILSEDNRTFSNTSIITIISIIELISHYVENTKD